jgi:predicted DNA-binding transcriptional regulator YafY
MGRAWPVQYPVEAVVQAPAAAVRQRIGRWATVSDDGGGACRVLVEADDLDWPATALAMTGAEFTVITPPELVDHLRRMAGRLAAAADRSRSAVPHD